MTGRDQSTDKSRGKEDSRLVNPAHIQAIVQPSVVATDWSERLTTPNLSPAIETTVKGGRLDYAIPVEQQEVFATLMSRIRSVRSVRPLIISNVHQPTGLKDVYEAAAPLAAAYAISAAENRSNALRFIDVLARHKDDRGLEAIVLRSAMLSCYSTLEKIVDSKALQLKPSGGIDADDVIATAISHAPIYAGLLAVGLGGAFISGAFHTLGWLGLAGMAVEGGFCIFRRGVLSIIRGGVGELKYTNAILKLRSFMEAKL